MSYFTGLIMILWTLYNWNIGTTGFWQRRTLWIWDFSSRNDNTDRLMNLIERFPNILNLVTQSNVHCK